MTSVGLLEGLASQVLADRLGGDQAGRWVGTDLDPDPVRL
jgi:hypothetical protein